MVRSFRSGFLEGMYSDISQSDLEGVDIYRGRNNVHDRRSDVD